MPAMSRTNPTRSGIRLQIDKYDKTLGYYIHLAVLYPLGFFVPIYHRFLGEIISAEYYEIKLKSTIPSTSKGHLFYALKVSAISVFTLSLFLASYLEHMAEKIPRCIYGFLVWTTDTVTGRYLEQFSLYGAQITRLSSRIFAFHARCSV